MNTVWKLLELGIVLSLTFSGCVPTIFGDRYAHDVPKLRITEEEKQILREFFDVNGRPDVSLDRAAFVRTNDSMRVDSLFVTDFPGVSDSLVIPPSFLQLMDLKFISIFSTTFRDVPAEFALLPSLTELEIGASPLQTITENILVISSLELLKLTNCPIEQITSDIDRLSNLKRLSVTHTNITTIPPEIVNIANLDVLILPNNQINALPREILRMNYGQFRIFNNKLCGLDSAVIAWLSRYPDWDMQNCD